MDGPALAVSWWKKPISLSSLAICLGLALILVGAGAGIAHLIQKQSESKILTTPGITTSFEEEITLQVDEPAPNTTTNDSIMKIAGTTAPNTAVIVFGSKKSKFTTSDASGNFEVMLELNSGLNMLSITAIANDGRQKTISLAVEYTIPKGSGI
jgi:hypothetical protein